MRFNVSAIQTFEECPRKWWYSYVLERAAPSTEAMGFGTAWHDLAERVDLGGYLPDTFDLDAHLESFPEHEAELLARGLEGFIAWIAGATGLQLGAAEKELSASICDGKHTLFGRLDRIVWWRGGYWHLQHKTVAQGKPLPVYFRAVQRSYHEHAYRHLLETNGYAPYKGTVLCVLQKRSAKWLRENQVAPFIAEELCTGPAHDDIMFALEETVEQMAAWRQLWQEGDALPPQRPASCDGFFHNRLCHFIDVCDGYQPLRELESRNPLEKYDAS